MKILLVNWMDMYNPLAGGAEVHLNEIFRRFVQRGDEVTFISSGFKGCTAYDEYDGIRIIRTGSRETFNLTAPKVLRKLDRKENFDLIVEDINKIPLYTPLYLKKPLLVIIPHLFGSTVFRETNPLLASYVYLTERLIPYIYRNVMFEVISKSTANDINKRGIKEDHIRIVHCGMDHETYSVDDTLSKFEQPTILYVGRIKRYKSVDVILKVMPEVFVKIPDARLVIVGSGDNLPELKRLAQKLGISEKVVFTGFVSMEEKVDWMRRSHVNVNPSPKEGWGLTNIEANACGTIAVASDADGLRDSVKDGETGLLFPYGDQKNLADKIIQILRNEELRERLTKNAIKWAGNFTWDKCARKTMEVVEEVIERKVK
ncbi:MAG TPA: glycosyltransferase family 1 protein [bacterium]|nr:glycosyltransferase family 1 protein [bacterium]